MLTIRTTRPIGHSVTHVGAAAPTHCVTNTRTGAIVLRSSQGGCLLAAQAWNRYSPLSFVVKPLEPSA